MAPRTSKGLDRLQIQVGKDNRDKYHFQKIAAMPSSMHQPNMLGAKDDTFVVSADHVSEFIPDPKVRTRFRLKVMYHPKLGKTNLLPD